MKTFLLAGATALALLATLPSPVSAQSTADYYPEKTFNSVVFPAADPTKLWVVVEPAQRQSVEVELSDSKGHILHHERVTGKPKAFRQRFDLSGLRDGVYTIRISDGTQTEERTFRLSSAPRLEEQLPTRQLSAVAGR